MKKEITEEMKKKAIEMLADGATRAEVAKAWQVSYQTWWRYLLAHPEFADKADNARYAYLDAVEDSAAKAAVGYEYTERSVKRRKEPDRKAADGTIIPGEVTVEITETTKYCPPNLTAAQFILRNRRPKDWNKERTTLELDGSPNVTILLQPVTPDGLPAPGFIIDAETPAALLPAPATEGEEQQDGKKKPRRPRLTPHKRKRVHRDPERYTKYHRRH